MADIKINANKVRGKLKGSLASAFKYKNCTFNLAKGLHA